MSFDITTMKRSRTISSSASSPQSTCSTYNLRNLGPPSYVKFCGTECPICLDDFNSPVIANCGHSFCGACLEKCMKKGTENMCPLCKTKMIKNLFIYNVEYTRHVASHNDQYLNSIENASPKRTDKNANHRNKSDQGIEQANINLYKL